MHYIIFVSFVGLDAPTVRTLPPRVIRHRRFCAAPRHLAERNNNVLDVYFIVHSSACRRRRRRRRVFCQHITLPQSRRIATPICDRQSAHSNAVVLHHPCILLLLLLSRTTDLFRCATPHPRDASVANCRSKCNMSCRLLK